jgi:hypothetical protein
MITYRIVPGATSPDRWAVERTVPGELPKFIESFDTEGEAQTQVHRLAATKDGHRAMARRERELRQVSPLLIVGHQILQFRQESGQISED